MYYFRWVEEDSLRTVEVVGKKGETDKQTRERSLVEYGEIAKRAGISELSVDIQTVDVKYIDSKEARVYTFLCDVNPKIFTEMCRQNGTPEKLSVIVPKDDKGNNFVDQFGNPQKYFFVKAEYKSAKVLNKKAEEICRNRNIKYSGNILQVFSVFHANNERTKRNVQVIEKPAKPVTQRKLSDKELEAELEALTSTWNDLL